ncbi:MULTISPECIES: type IV secretion system protein VirB10 [unclassified Shinella]|uniref:type IV secretion system protein VirB10 n=1 Tax=unclassified Shinella TaxID=2643062 RepID=UPI00234E3E41|nr:MULTISPECIES: type IV secretion system protein VirB10 [unclassified Shinella]MCO5154053.1 type IV secretion system protein VirB10 [Shinella sp.]MDC7266975.1 type IV secretion system protein VirB10 [Shinella sp. HY16]MDC7273872.1 type IV secretion system protein VirB10 [Shinella sp. YZ44]
MSKIDFDHLDGQSSVASDRNGRLGKFALPVLLVVGAGVLAYVNWPSGPQTSNLTEGTGETFETSNTSIRDFPDEPAKQAADPNLVQIPVEEKKPADSATVDVTVNQGDDLEKLRQIEEERRRAEEERLRAEEARRRAEEDARLAALEAKRREEEEKARWERLRSEQIIVDGSGRESLAASDQSVTIAEDGQLVAVPGAESDANKAFLAQSEKQTAGIVKATRFDRTDALVAQGTMIRGFLETAINTDLPGMVRAVVREDVRSLDGARILIPKGSRLIGEYKSGLARGQKRIFVVWSRVIRSDGLSAEIASPGADRLGRAGLTGEIDTHFWERFGSAIILSVIGGAAEYVSALGDTASESARSISTVDPITGAVTTITTQPSRTSAEARSIAAEKSSAILQDIANEAFKESSKIPPTIYVAQGESIIVYLRRDLDFSAFYADPVRQEMMRLKRGGQIRRNVDPTPYYPVAPVYK